VVFSFVTISRSSAVKVAPAARDNTMRSRPAPSASNGGSYEATIETKLPLPSASEIVRFASSEGNNRPAGPVGRQRSGTTTCRPTQSNGNTSTSTCLANPRDPPGPTRIRNDAPSSAARLDSSIRPPSARAASSAARAALNGNDNGDCASRNTNPHPNLIVALALTGLPDPAQKSRPVRRPQTQRDDRSSLGARHDLTGESKVPSQVTFDTATLGTKQTQVPGSGGAISRRFRRDTPSRGSTGDSLRFASLRRGWNGLPDSTRRALARFRRAGVWPVPGRQLNSSFDHLRCLPLPRCRRSKRSRCNQLVGDVK